MTTIYPNQPSRAARKAMTLAMIVACTLSSPLIASASCNTYRVDNGDAFVWKMTATANPEVYYVKGRVDATSNSSINVTQTVYASSIGQYVTFPVDIASNCISSREGMSSILANASMNPHWVSKTYAGRDVTCLSFQVDPTNYGFIDNATCVVCELQYSQGSTVTNFIIMSWTDQDLSVYKQETFPFSTTEMVIIAIVVIAMAVFFVAIMQMKKREMESKATQQRGRHR